MSKRRSFFNPVNERSFIQVTNDDDAERATHRGENDLETQLSSLSISINNKNGLTPNGKSPARNNLPLFQLQDHFQTCLKMYTTNKINTQNAWQLDVFTYMQKLLTSEEKTSNILQVAGSSIEVGTKIYCARIDDTHSEILKLANALNKVHIREHDESISEDKNPNSDGEDNNDVEQKLVQKRFRKKKTRNKGDIENKVTIYPCDTPLNAPVNRLYSNGQENTDKIDLLDTGKYHKPGFVYELFNTTEARSFKWATLGLETRSKARMMKNTLFTEPPIAHKICKKLSNFQVDVWNLDDETDLNSTGNYTQMSDPVEDDYHYEPNATVFSEVETAANNADRNGLVFITDMKPGSDDHNESSLHYEYSFRSLPNISENFKVTGAWVGPSRWKLKWVRGNNLNKKSEDMQTTIIKKQVKRTPKCEPLPFKETSIEEIKNILVRTNKKTVKKTNSAKDSCTCSEYMDILEERRITLMTRPKVKVYRSKCENQKEIKEENLNITNYDYDNLNDSEYCPTEPLNNWEDGDKPAEIDGENNMNVEEPLHNASLHLMDKSVDLDTPLNYALKAKVMDMKKLKNAVWDEISTKCHKESSENNIEDKSMTFSKVYEKLPNKLSATLNENLSAPLAFVALLHLANEHNLFLRSENFLDISISKSNT